MYFGERRTGRTTRMLKAAITSAKEGHNVAVVAFSDEYASSLKKEVDSLLFDSPFYGLLLDSPFYAEKETRFKNLITFYTGGSTRFLSMEDRTVDMSGLWVEGYFREDTFFDHYTIEVYLQKTMHYHYEELWKYDKEEL